MKQMYSKEEIENLIANAPLYSHTLRVRSVQEDIGLTYATFELVNHNKAPLFEDITKTSATMSKLGNLYDAGFFKFKTGTFYDSEENPYTIFAICSEGIGENAFDLMLCLGDDANETIKYQYFSGGEDLELAYYEIRNEAGETIYFVEV